MATKKKMLQAAAGQAGAGGAALDITDVFSTYLYEGTGAGQTIQNGVNLGQQAKSGEFTDRNAAYPVHLNSAISLSGDFTVEAWVYNDPPNATSRVVFGSDFNAGATNYQFAITSTSHLVTYSNNTFVTATSQPLSTQQWYHIAASRSGSTIYLWVDGQAAGSGTDSNTFIFQNIGALGGYTSDASWVGNISNLRVSNTARYTSSFTPATEALSSDANTILLALQDPPFVDQTNTYSVSNDSSVNASTLSPFGDAAEAGEGGLVWIKARNANSYHSLWDTERGTNRAVFSHLTNAESNFGSNTLTSFNSNGFSSGSAGLINDSAENYASWTFRKAPKFFDVVTYTGNGTSQTISHNLTVAPAVIITKRTDTTSNWLVYHTSISTQNIYLNKTDAVAGTMGITSVADASYAVNGSSELNENGGTYVAYIFAHNNGDGGFGPDGDQDIIKCGTYEGNGGTQEIDLGFEPQWVMIKNIESRAYQASLDWNIFDNMREWANRTSGDNNVLVANEADAETALARCFPTANGFAFYNDGAYSLNASGDTYIYMAIRRGPLAQPESATEVFDVFAGDDTFPTVITTGFTADSLFGALRSGLSINFMSGSRLTSNKSLITSSTAAQGEGLYSDVTNGCWMRNDGILPGIFGQSNTVYYTWKRAPGFFDVVAYTGTGSVMTVNHNLGVAPEMMWVKCRSNTKDWAVYHSDLGSTNEIRLNATSPAFGTTAWNNTTPTDSVFTLGVLGRVNSAVIEDYIAYLFATVPGVSKVGSFTGTGGSGQTIDCGFTSGARFVLIKRTDSSTYGDWYVWDSERGIVAGNDPRLSLNTTSAEVLADTIDPHSSGFSTVPSTIVDQSGASYIFYAIA